MKCPKCNIELQQLPSETGSFCPECSFQQLNIPGVAPSLDEQEEEVIEFEQVSERHIPSPDSIYTTCKKAFSGDTEIELTGHGDTLVCDPATLDPEYYGIEEIDIDRLPTIAYSELEEIMYGS